MGTRKPASVRATSIPLHFAFAAACMSLTGCREAPSEEVEEAAGAVTSSTRWLSAGYRTSCAQQGGPGYCWGDNEHGQLGAGYKKELATSPVYAIYKPLEIASGRQHGCTNQNFSLLCWGSGSEGQIGNGTMTDAFAPTGVVGIPSGSLAFSPTGGKAHSCGISGTDIYCWGDGTKGQLGHGAWTSSTTAVAVVGLGDAPRRVAAGNDHTCAHLANGDVHCWGSNGSGQHGNGTTAFTPVPDTRVLLPAAALAIGVGGEHGCAVVDDGSSSLYCWGANTSGQLGLGSPAPSYFTPQLVASGIQAVSAGDKHTCAIAFTGSLYCWGANGYGQLGDGTTLDRSTPTLVDFSALGPSVEITGVAAGYTHTCAEGVRPVPGGTSSFVVCWGDNDRGQLGDGSTTPKLAPTIPVVFP